MLTRTCLVLVLVHVAQSAGAADFSLRAEGTIVKNGAPFLLHGFNSELGIYPKTACLAASGTVAGRDGTSSEFQTHVPMAGFAVISL